MRQEAGDQVDRATEIVEKNNNREDLKISVDEKSKDQSPLVTEAAVPEVQDKPKDASGKDNV